MRRRAVHHAPRRRAPGASIGTLTVQGKLTMTASASYLVEVS